MEATTGAAKESYASAMVAAAGKFDAAAMEAVAGVTKESDLTNGRGSPPPRRSRAQRVGIPARGTVAHLDVDVWLCALFDWLISHQPTVLFS
jgi:hypothetical protein